VERFQDPNNELRFFVGQPRTGGYGLTLTAAHTMIYYANGYDLETRLQSEARIDRYGQTHKMTYIDLIYTQYRGREDRRRLGEEDGHCQHHPSRKPTRLD
jgi:hypothetical protein